MGASEAFAYTLRYSNASRETAPDSYVIDAVPDVLINAPAITSDPTATVYYSTVNPAALGSGVQYPSFDPTNPAGPGADWTTTLPASGTTFIGVKVGTLSANSSSQSITIPAVAKLSNGSIAPLGTTWINTAIISTKEIDDSCSGLIGTSGVISSTDPLIVAALALCQDENPENNKSQATTQVPGVDMSISKTGTIEGSFPGGLPGDTITYTIEYTNTGAEYACGVKIEDTLPTLAGASLLDISNTPSEAHSLSTVQLKNNDGETVYPANGPDPLAIGWSEITDPISVSYSKSALSLTWYLGHPSAGNPDDYREICLPPGAHGVFEVRAKVRDTLADSTALTNTATVSLAPGGQIDTVIQNNSDTSATVIYRPDLLVTKE